VIFGNLPTTEALGAVLGHTTRLPDRVLAKGTVLQLADLAALQAAGHPRIIAARLEPGDMAEDAAAQALGTALIAPGLALRLPGTGRANLIAETPGLFRAEAALVDALNGVDDSLTLGTLADATPVYPGDMVATVKIIPFAAPAAAVARAAALASSTPALRLAPFRNLLCGLVLTTLPGMKPSILEGTITAMQGRIARLTGSLLPPVQCFHEASAIASCLETLGRQGAALLLVAGASAVVDRQDVAPSGIVAAGGKILHLGMPVDPGNLLCLATIGTTPALVLPGCARSSALNGIDFALARIFADEPLGAENIRRMGVGGLLKEFSARPAPRIGRRS